MSFGARISFFGGPFHIATEAVVVVPNGAFVFGGHVFLGA